VGLGIRFAGMGRGWEQMFGEQVGTGLQLQPRAKLYFGVSAAYCSNFGHFTFLSHPLAP